MWKLVLDNEGFIDFKVCCLHAACTLFSWTITAAALVRFSTHVLSFPPAEFQKSKCALLRRSLGACSRRTQRCLMRVVHYPAAYSTACGKPLPGPRGDPGERACVPEAPFAVWLWPPQPPVALTMLACVFYVSVFKAFYRALLFVICECAKAWTLMERFCTIEGIP